MSLLAFVPPVAQVVYTVSSWPRLVALYRAKRSDQHSAGYHASVCAAHAAMLLYAIVEVEQAPLAFSYCVAIVTAAAPLALIVYYRRHPGGRRAS